MPFDQIIPQVLAGKYEAGLIIHEGQLTYNRSGLHKVIDLGVWWRETTKLVLPLGGNAIRRSLGAEAHGIISKALRDSIQHGLDHREQALEYAMQFARDLDTSLASRFVSMYVNERTLDYGRMAGRPSASCWRWDTNAGSSRSSRRWSSSVGGLHRGASSGVLPDLFLGSTQKLWLAFRLAKVLESAKILGRSLMNF